MTLVGVTHEKSKPLRTPVILKHKEHSIPAKFACFASTSTCLFVTNRKIIPSSSKITYNPTSWKLICFLCRIILYIYKRFRVEIAEAGSIILFFPEK